MEDDAAEYLILMNRENQYRLWLASETLPDGWMLAPRSPCGTRLECLKWFEVNVPGREVN